MRSRDHILLEETNAETDFYDPVALHQKIEQQNKCMKIQTSVTIMTVAALCIFGFYVFDGSEAISETMFGGGYQDDCGVCETISGIDEYTVCRTCPFVPSEDNSLVCPAEFGNIMVTKIRSGDGVTFSPRDQVASLYNFCQENFVDNECAFNFQDDILTTYSETTNEEGQLQMVQHTEKKPVDDQIRIDYTCSRLEASEVLLSSTALCGTCTNYDGIDDYAVCKTCGVPTSEDITLSCDAPYTQAQPYWIKYRADKHNSDLLADVYHTCQEQWDTTTLSCVVNIDAIYAAWNVVDTEEEPTDEYVPVVLVDEDGNVIDDNFEDPTNQRKKRKSKDVKIYYNCIL